jgi:transketolase
MTFDQIKLDTLRKYILLSLANKGSGHLGGSLGALESILVLNSLVDYPQDWFSKYANLPKSEQLQLATNLRSKRNKFILSGGHICPALYAVLADLGLFDEIIEAKWEELDLQSRVDNLVQFGDVLDLDWLETHKKRVAYLSTFRELNSDLQGHPSLEHLPFLIDSSTGPLGQGVGMSVGYAHGDKLLANNLMTYATLGDGEAQEGQVWEAAMLAAKLKLDNLVWVLDRNYIQIDGDTESVGGLDKSQLGGNGLANKFKSFGWQVLENPNGNSTSEFTKVLDQASKTQKNTGLPLIIINYTQVGHPFKIFNNYHWHGKTPNTAEVKQALNEK